MDWVMLRSRGKELVRKYRYVLLVVLAGLFLMFGAVQPAGFFLMLAVSLHMLKNI